MDKLNSKTAIELHGNLQKDDMYGVSVTISNDLSPTNVPGFPFEFKKYQNTNEIANLIKILPFDFSQIKTHRYENLEGEINYITV